MRYETRGVGGAEILATVTCYCPPFACLEIVHCFQCPIWITHTITISILYPPYLHYMTVLVGTEAHTLWCVCIVTDDTSNTLEQDNVFVLEPRPCPGPGLGPRWICQNVATAWWPVVTHHSRKSRTTVLVANFGTRQWIQPIKYIIRSVPLLASPSPTPAQFKYILNVNKIK